MALNISKTKVMYISSSHTQPTINISDTDIMLNNPLLAIAQMKND